MLKKIRHTAEILTETPPEPPDLDAEIRRLTNDLEKAKKAEKKRSNIETTDQLAYVEATIAGRLAELKKIETNYYAINGTKNFIAIKNRSNNLKLRFTYFLVNQEKEILSNPQKEYIYMYCLADKFLVAKEEGGLLTFIDKNSGQILNSKKYEEIKLIKAGGEEKIIALSNNNWYWICGNSKKYKFPLASEMSDGYLRINVDKDGFLWVYDNSGKAKILVPKNNRDNSIAA